MLVNNKLQYIFDKIKKTINSKYFEIICVMIYTFLIYFGFLVFIQPEVYEEKKTHFSLIKCVITIPVIMFIFYRIKSVKCLELEFYLKIFLYLMVIPISCVYVGKDYSIGIYLALMLQILIIIYTITIMQKIFQKINWEKYTKKIKKILNKKILTKLIFTLFIINTLVVLVGCCYYNSLPSLTAFNLNNVYTVRENFYLPNILSYLFVFETQFIITFFIILFIDKKQYILTSISIVLQILFFLWKGDKITLLSIPLSVGIYYIFKLVGNNINKLLPAIFAMTVFVSMLIYGITAMAFGIFVMRLCITPAMLKFIHIDFFSKNSKIGLVGTIINSILKEPNPYSDMPYPNVIAEQYFNKPSMYSSTGFLAEGYARFGWIGIILIPIILGILLFVFSKKINSNNKGFFMGISILAFMSLNEKHLLPSLTFGSLLLLYVVILFFEKDYINIGRKSKEKE